MIKIFRGGGRGGDTFKLPSLPPTNNFCLYPPPVFRGFCKDSLMTLHHPTSSILHCYPLPHQPPLPPPKKKNFDHTPGPNRVKSLKICYYPPIHGVVKIGTLFFNNRLSYFRTEVFVYAPKQGVNFGTFDSQDRV